MKTNESQLKNYEGKLDDDERLIEASIDKLNRRVSIFNMLAWLFVIIGFVPLVLLLFHQNTPLKLSEIGDFIGGTAASFWSLAGLFFIYVAFINQQKQVKLQSLEIKYNREELKLSRKELRGQREQLEKQNFENTFFKLVDLHKKNLDVWEIRENVKVNNQYVRTDFFHKYWAVYKFLLELVRDYSHIKKRKPSLTDKEIAKKIISSTSFYDNYFKTIKEIIYFTKDANDIDKNFYLKVFMSQLSEEEILISWLYFLALDVDDIVAVLENTNEINVQKWVEKSEMN